MNSKGSKAGAKVFRRMLQFLSPKRDPLGANLKFE